MVGLVLIAYGCEQVIRLRDPVAYAALVEKTKNDIAARDRQREADGVAAAAKRAQREQLDVSLREAAQRAEDVARQAEEADDRARAAEIAALKRSGFGCLSGNGSNASTIRELKAILRNPSSFEHIKTNIFPSIHGEHALVMRYRAQNGFGGMNVETVSARVNATTCRATLLPTPQEND